MEVLVTGAAGFIGSNLVSRLASQGGQVRAFVLPGDASSWEGSHNIHAIEGDVRDYASVAAAAAGVRHIYHLAALTAPDPENAQALYDVNVRGTEHVARAALEHRVERLVYMSSVAIHGRRTRLHDIDEDTPARPDSPYARSKLQAEQLLRSLRDSDRLPVVIARTSNVFGPGVLDWLEFFRGIAAGQFRFIGQGRGLMHVTSVEDLCEGLRLCAERTGVEGRCYILTGSESISLREWIEMIRAEVGGVLKTPAVPAAPLHLYNVLNSAVYAVSRRELPRADRLNLFLGDRSFNIGKARAELGFEPGVSAQALVRMTADWYRSRGWL